MSENEVLWIQDLRMKYDNRYVLNGIDLEVRRGEMIGYIGPNGAGKSTTVKIMLGLVEGTRGQSAYSVRIFPMGISIINGESDMSPRWPNCTIS